MEKGRTFIVVYITVIILLIIAGIVWHAYDVNHISQLDYRRLSKNIGVYGDYSDPRVKVAELRDSLSSYIHIIREYQPEKSIWEIIGQNRSWWFISGYMHRVTVIDAMMRPKDGSSPPTRQILVFAMFIPTGAMPLTAIALFLLIIIPARFIKKTNLPHLFPETATDREEDSGNQGPADRRGR